MNTAGMNTAGMNTAGMNTAGKSARAAVVYWRVSTDEQMSGTSPDGQREAGLRKAAELGARVVAVCGDPGVSGTRYTSRPGIVEALRLIEAGEANVLIAAKIDRIGRSAAVILDIVKRVHQAGGDVVTLDAQYDRSPMGQMMLTMLAGMAQMERDTIRERTKGGAVRRAQAGVQPQRSRSPFGLHVVTKKDREQGLHPDAPAGTYVLTDAAPTVAEMFTRYDMGQSLREVCRWLNGAGVGTQFGGAYWRPSQLKKVLVNPCYMGQATYGKHLRRAEEVGERTVLHLDIQEDFLTIDCPALVDEATWRRVQARLSEARAVFGGNPERRHLLGGLLRCPLCGRGMHGTKRDKPTHGGRNVQHEHVYRCPDSRQSRNAGGVVCNRKAYHAHRAEPAVLRGILDLARRPELVPAALAAYRRREEAGRDPQEAARLAASLRALDARERATVEAQVAGIQAGADPGAYASAFAKIAGERAALSARLRAVEAAQGPGRDEAQDDDAALLARALADVEAALTSAHLTDGERHGLLALLIERVVPEDAGEDAPDGDGGDGGEVYRVYLRGMGGVEKGHSVLLVGPPGSGKTMLARRLPSVLPPLSLDEALDVTKVYSVGGLLGTNTSLVTRRPFRSPHHSVSNAALAGGGSTPRPGEVSLADHGILFLDELPEFRRDVLEVLRQPLEDGHVTIARVAGTMTYPARIMLVAAMNPCPCGYFGDTVKTCSCSQPMIQKYLQRISGPLLDRIDIHIEVPRLRQDEMLHAGGTGEPSAAIQARVVAARERQTARFAGTALHCNARMGARQLKSFCPVAEDVRDLLRAAVGQLGLSARAYDRILKLARTVADLEGTEAIGIAHVAEAIQYRALDRKLWG